MTIRRTDGNVPAPVSSESPIGADPIRADPRPAEQTTGARARDWAERTGALAVDGAAPAEERLFKKIGAQANGPKEPPSLTVDRTGARIVVEAEESADRIRVSNRPGGGVRVSDGKTTLDLTDAEARNLEIRSKGGDDRIKVALNVAYDITIDAGAGNDRIRGGRANDSIEGGTGADRIRSGGGTDLISGNDGADRIRSGRGVDVIDGGDGDDQLRAGRGDDMAYGGADRDRIRGGAGADMIDGRDQNDDLRGGAGADAIEGGAGWDQVRGGAGADRIAGGSGDDRARGGRGRDVVYGDGGDDHLEGGGGRDLLAGDAGEDTLEGGARGDVLYGLDGRDRIWGGKGRDYADGGRGDDRVHGQSGRDAIMGGRGNDRLYGEGGRDSLAGGHDTDRFDGGAGGDQVFHERNEIADGQQRQDAYREVDMSGADPGSSIDILDKGDARFQAHVQSDLDALRSLPTGRGLLSAIDANPHHVSIKRDVWTNESLDTGKNPNRLMLPGDAVNGPGASGTVKHDPEIMNLGRKPPRAQAWEEFRPVVALGHELIHAENAQRGAIPNNVTEGERNAERGTVGQTIDHDGNPATPRLEGNRWSENGLRSELADRTRTRYLLRK